MLFTMDGVLFSKLLPWFGIAILTQVELPVKAVQYIVPIPGIDQDFTIELGITNTDSVAPNIVVNATYFQHNATNITDTTSYIDPLLTVGLSMTITQNNALNGSGIANTSLHVQSEHMFDLQVIVKTPDHNEGFRALNKDLIGSEYFVSTFCALGGYCQLAIATVRAGITQVYIQLPSDVDEVTFCVGTGTYRSSEHSTIPLEYPQVLQIETTHDLTGTFIYSNKKISVVAGTRSMPNDVGTLMHFSEQLVPTPHWGSEFVLTGLFTGYGSIVHITAYQRRTVVTITGFKQSTIRIPLRGGTIKRRIENGVTCYVTSNKPVQVMMYHGLTYRSNETLASVAMTLVPAIQHYQSNFSTSCPFTTATYLQYVTPNDAIMNHFAYYSTTAHVPYTNYDSKEETMIVNYGVFTLMLSPSVYSEFTHIGGVMKCDKAMYPIGNLILNSETLTCTASESLAYPGDGIDNDCDGEIDEDSCYENIAVVTEFNTSTSTSIETYTSNVKGFRMIKLRVLSCGISHVQLRDADSLSYVTLQMSTARMSLLLCDTSGCVMDVWMDTGDLFERNCETDVISYWFLQMGSTFCAGAGPIVPTTCKYETLSTSLSDELVTLHLTGRLNDAKFWYDVYGIDCGKLQSDWRCDDMITNCDEYPDDLCTKNCYETWVQANCRRFCGLCTVDSLGKMFVVPAMVTVPDFINLYIVGTDNTHGTTGVMSYINVVETIADDHVDIYGELTLPSASAMFLTDNETYYIVSDDEIAVYISHVHNAERLSLLLPYDALASEYMTLTFADGDDALNCEIIGHEGEVDVWMYLVSGIVHLQRSVLSQRVILSTNNQSGTVFKSTNGKPFAVFCGTDSHAFYGPSLNQLPPVNTWGTFHVTPALCSTANCTGSSIVAKVKLVTSSGNNVIEVAGEYDAMYIMYNKGDTLTLDITASISYSITSTHPVLVSMIHYPDSQFSEAIFNFIPAAANFMKGTVLYSHNFIPSSSNPDQDESITVTDESGNYTTTLIPDVSNSDAYFHIAANDSRAFSLAYMYLGSKMKLVPSTCLYKDFHQERICEISNDTVGDNVDSDCDGLVNEEDVCYTGYGAISFDADLDGGFGEDCNATAPATTNLTAPEEPICLISTDDDGSLCWKPCMCYCSWANNKYQYQQMSGKEQALYNDYEVGAYIKDLRLDVERLSTRVSQKESAPDERQSSTNIGAVGIAAVVVALAGIVIFDVISLTHYVRERWANR